MRNWLLRGLFGGAVATVMAAGCGGDDPSGAGGGGTTSSTGETTSSSVTVTSVTATVTVTSSGAMMGDGNDTFATAEQVDLSFDGIFGDLDPVGDVDFYKFDGLAGQALYIDVDAQALVDTSFDPVVIDTIVTLYDADEKQIAENRNYSSSEADPRLYTVLPADGTYYLRVTECWTWADTPADSCDGIAEKTEVAYELTLAALDPAEDQVVEEEEPNDTAAEGTPMTYSKFDDVSYYVTFGYGQFSSPGDVDVFRFTPPADVTVDGRTTVRFEPTLPGIDDNGSTTSIGRIAIVDPLNPLVALAESDNAKGATLWTPLTLGQEYLLFVEHPGGAAGAHDFYFYLHSIRGSNPPEAEEVTNDVLATPEVLTGEVNGNLFSYFLDGDIIGGALDVDHYQVDVTRIAPATLAVSCGARWYGSGVRDFTWTALETDGTPVTGGTFTEPDDGTAYKGDIAIPAGATNLIIKMSAGSQDPNVTSGYYHCGIHLVPN